jgi:hypothetical protein
VIDRSCRARFDLARFVSRVGEEDPAGTVRTPYRLALVLNIAGHRIVKALTVR